MTPGNDLFPNGSDGGGNMKLKFVFIHGTAGWGSYDRRYEKMPYWGMRGGDLISYLNKRDLTVMQRRFHRSEVHGTVPVSCMRSFTERWLITAAVTAELMVMKDSAEIIQAVL